MNSHHDNPRVFASDDRPVFRIIVYCLSLAFSVLVASLETVRYGDAGLTFQISWRTLLVFLAGAFFFVGCFKVIFHSAKKKLRWAALTLVSATGFGSFLYPLRFVRFEKLDDIFVGLLIAAGMLSVVGAGLFVMNRFLNADAQTADSGARR